MFPEFSIRGNKVRNLPGNLAKYQILGDASLLEDPAYSCLSCPQNLAGFLWTFLLGNGSLVFFMETDLPAFPHILSSVTLYPPPLFGGESEQLRRLGRARGCAQYSYISKRLHNEEFFPLQIWVSPKHCDNCVTSSGV